MGDVGDTFNALKKARKEKNAIAEEKDMEILKKSGLSYESKNYGCQLVFTTALGEKIDYWPQTGTWIKRKKGHPKGGTRGKRISSMLKRFFPEIEIAR